MADLDDKIKRKALAAAHLLNQMASVQAAYIFGSQVEGQADSWSDIDVAAFMEQVETWDIQQRAQAMTRVQREVGYDLETHLFPARALEQAEAGSFAHYILTHGVCIYQREATTPA